MREKITSAVFVAILFMCFVLAIIVPQDKEASVQENRPLAEMPELSFENIFFGTFCSDFETFLTDNVGFRSKFVNFGTKIEMEAELWIKPGEWTNPVFKNRVLGITQALSTVQSGNIIKIT